MFAARAPKAVAAKGTGFKQSEPRPEQPQNHHHYNSNSPKTPSKSAHMTPSSTSSSTVVNNAPAWRTLQEDRDETMHSTGKTSSSLTVGDDSLYYNTRNTMVALFGPLPREVEEALAKTGKRALVRFVSRSHHSLSQVC